MGRGGTEAFPDLGAHCDHENCNQLDFLPFTCDGCQKVFCLEHRTYKAHGCPKAEHNSRMVVVCRVCSMSIEKKAGEEDSTILERHERSGDCDARKKHKPRPAYAKDAKVPVRLPARNGTDCRDGKSSSVPSHQSLLTSH
ncbi:zinc finger AN1 domain-containing stress-associated protein 12 [Cocos nucifera]|uniref:Zinc finger AN1 domain-containing stress-associated protein 12 n=1 Tax=Cocos nucifera TaxID=13894 RepID=A0A8K0MUI6_COCNU|nr:zinc finger AN1 domain-containing stress-associated protein 12 [Cocos nucifera]